MVKAEGKNEYVLNEYTCGWCSFLFRQYVRRIESDNDIVTGKKLKGSVSSQVKCPVCENFLPTWTGCKEIERVNVKGVLMKRVVLV